jgi:hypothetical protein
VGGWPAGLSCDNTATSAKAEIGKSIFHTGIFNNAGLVFEEKGLPLVLEGKINLSYVSRMYLILLFKFQHAFLYHI